VLNYEVPFLPESAQIFELLNHACPNQELTFLHLQCVFRMQNLQIVLTREHQSTPWGFRLKGGAEYNVPLSVLKVSCFY
jgi:hypothetical protein